MIPDLLKTCKSAQFIDGPLFWNASFGVEFCLATRKLRGKWKENGDVQLE